MSSHWTDPRNQCNVGVRAELQVTVNLTFDRIQFYHYIKEKKDVLKAASSSEKCYCKRRQKEGKYPTVSWGRKKYVIF